MTVTPPIPLTCAHRPAVGGLVAPFVNARLADGGVDFRSPHQSAYEKCWRQLLCQTCGQLLTHRCVIFGGPNQLRNLRFDEPPLCGPCAVYASQACPMVAGRQPFYADRQRLTEGKRGHTCGTAGCQCGGWIPADPDDAADTAGDPAHPWFACWIIPGAWDLTGHHARVPCAMQRGETDTPHRCNERHERLLINGCQLRTPPGKIMLVSAPGRGRVWTRITYRDALTLA